MSAFSLSLQLMLALPFPSANKTINFALDTLRRRTLVTVAALEELGVSDGQGKGEQSDFGACVELPAARIGREYGDHFLVAMDAVVGNDEQASTPRWELLTRVAQPSIPCP